VHPWASRLAVWREVQRTIAEQVLEPNIQGHSKRFEDVQIDNARGVVSVFANGVSVDAAAPAQLSGRHIQQLETLFKGNLDSHAFNSHRVFGTRTEV